MQFTRLAVVNATHKGQRIEIDGLSFGGEGVDGRQQYVIARHAKGYLTCGCPAFKFQRGPRHLAPPCKHIKAFIARQCGAEVLGGAVIRKVACEVREVASA
jgi:hypothetical protein